MKLIISQGRTDGDGRRGLSVTVVARGVLSLVGNGQDGLSVRLRWPVYSIIFGSCLVSRRLVMGNVGIWPYAMLDSQPSCPKWYINTVYSRGTFGRNQSFFLEYINRVGMCLKLHVSPLNGSDRVYPSNQGNFLFSYCSSGRGCIHLPTAM